MSGTGVAVAALSTAADVVSAISGLPFDAGTGAIVLGSFVFERFDSPPAVVFGGAQQTDVKRLIGGQRIVDVLGPDDRMIEWAGTLMDGPELKAQQLDMMRAAGAPLPLTWGIFYYTVVIAHFEADIRFKQATYRISCLIISDPANDPPPPDPSLSSSLTGDSNSAVASGPPGSQGALGDMQDSVSGAPSLDAGSSGLAGVGTGVTAAQTSLAGVQAGAETSIDGVAAVAAPGDLVSSAGDITNLVAQTTLLAQARTSVGYVNRMGVNVGLGAGV